VSNEYFPEQEGSMNFRKSMLFIFFAVFSCQSYAHENEYVLVGQNSYDGQADTAFVLELVGDNLEDYVHINENGEVYLKVDKIVAIPRAQTQFPPLRDESKCISVEDDMVAENPSLRDGNALIVFIGGYLAKNAKMHSVRRTIGVGSHS
jgi:hypothetical protein